MTSKQIIAAVIMALIAVPASGPTMSCFEGPTAA